MAVKLQSLRRTKACTAGDVIAEIERKGLSVGRSIVINLVGSDSIRTIASYRTAMVGGLHKSVNESHENDFSGLCLHEARQLAVKDRDFDSLLWSKYLKAEKIWGRQALGTKGVAAYL